MIKFRNENNLILEFCAYEYDVISLYKLHYELDKTEVFQ